MKRLLAATVLVVIICVAYFTGDMYVKRVLDESNRILTECTENYKSDKDASVKAKELKEYWEKQEGWLSIFANHTMIDSIELAISSLNAYSKSENNEIFYEYSSAIHTLLHQLQEDNSLTMHSVL